MSLHHIVVVGGTVVGAGAFNEGGAPPAPEASCVVSGTITSIDQNDGVTGSYSATLTLTNESLEPTVGADNAISTAIIAGVTCAQTETYGFTNIISPLLDYTHITRVSDSVMTIGPFPAAATYATTANETWVFTLPASALQYSSVAVVATPNITVATIEETVTLTGTAVPSMHKGVVVTGSSTIIGTVAGDQNVAILGESNQTTTDFLAAFVAATSPTNGWNNEVLALLDYTHLSATAQQWTLTLPAVPNYAIDAAEVVTFTQPASSLLASSSPIVASPTVTVQNLVTPTISGATGTLSTDESVTVSGGAFQATGPTAELLKDNIEAGTDGAAFSKTGWDNPYGDPDYDMHYTTDDKYRKTQSLKCDFGVANKTLRHDFGEGKEEIYWTSWVRFIKTDAATRFQWKVGRVSSSAAYVPLPAGVNGNTFWYGSDPALDWRLGFQVHMEGEGPTEGDRDQDYYFPSPYDAFLFNTWMRLEYFYKKSTTETYNGELFLTRIGRAGGALIDSTTVLTHTTATATDLWRYLMFGQFYGNLEPPATTKECVLYWDDFYTSNTRARVELGNNADFDSCTIREIQEVTSWSDASIGITFNQGNFASSATAYLFVVDQDGTVSDGFEVTIA